MANFDSLLTPRNRIKSLALLVLCVVSAAVAVMIGINDNPPGVLLAFLSALAFVLAFVHPWRTARKFIFLFLASLAGFALFILASIVSDSIVQDPAGPAALQDLIESPANEALSVIFSMLCAAAFIVGVLGAAGLFVRGRLHPPGGRRQPG